VNAETAPAGQGTPGGSTDWFLQSLVMLVNKSDIQLGITLQVGGMLVSGSLVGGAAYFAGFADDISAPFAENPEVADAVKASYLEFSQIYRPDSTDGEVPPPMFIHLKDARIFGAAAIPIPMNRGVWWRGRVSEVSAFVLGTLSSTAQS
jgi:hypothetical protein